MIKTRFPSDPVRDCPDAGLSLPTAQLLSWHPHCQTYDRTTAALAPCVSNFIEARVMIPMSPSRLRKWHKCRTFLFPEHICERSCIHEFLGDTPELQEVEYKADENVASFTDDGITMRFNDEVEAWWDTIEDHYDEDGIRETTQHAAVVRDDYENNFIYKSFDPTLDYWTGDHEPTEVKAWLSYGRHFVAPFENLINMRHWETDNGRLSCCKMSRDPAFTVVYYFTQGTASGDIRALMLREVNATGLNNEETVVKLGHAHIAGSPVLCKWSVKDLVDGGGDSWENHMYQVFVDYGGDTRVVNVSNEVKLRDVLRSAHLQIETDVFYILGTPDRRSYSAHGHETCGEFGLTQGSTLRVNRRTRGGVFTAWDLRAGEACVRCDAELLDRVAEGAYGWRNEADTRMQVTCSSSCSACKTRVDQLLGSHKTLVDLWLPHDLYHQVTSCVMRNVGRNPTKSTLQESINLYVHAEHKRFFVDGPEGVALAAAFCRLLPAAYSDESVIITPRTLLGRIYLRFACCGTMPKGKPSERFPKRCNDEWSSREIQCAAHEAYNRFAPGVSYISYRYNGASHKFKDFELANVRVRSTLRSGYILHKAVLPGLLDMIKTRDGHEWVVAVDGTDIIAERIAPCIVHTEMHHKDASSVCRAFLGRIGGAVNGGFRMSRVERHRLASFVQSLTHMFFNRDAVVEWITNNTQFSELRSTSTSLDAWEAALRQALTNIPVESCVKSVADRLISEFDVMIKGEPGKPGKDPRPIMNVGLRNQVVAALVIRCGEELWFKKRNDYDDVSGPTPITLGDSILNIPISHGATPGSATNYCHIKGVNKARAIRRVIMDAQSVGGSRKRGHGTSMDTKSFDACMTPDLREATEIPILVSIASVFEEHLSLCDIPNPLTAAGMQIRRRKKYGMKLNTRAQCSVELKSTVLATIDAIRLSGDRGTTFLNCVIKIISILFSLLKYPATYFERSGPESQSRRIQPATARRFEAYLRDRNGRVADGYSIRLAVNVEGDDGLLYSRVFRNEKDGYGRTTERELSGQETADLYDKYLVGTTASMGLTEEIYSFGDGLARQTGEYAGVFLYCDSGGMRNAYAPDPLRSLRNGAWSTSAAILKHGIDEHPGRLAAFMSQYSRGLMFPNTGASSCVRAYFHACARSYADAYKGAVQLDRDTSRKLGVHGEVDLFSMGIALDQEMSWMDSEFVDRIIDEIAGVVTPEEALRMRSTHILSRDSDVGRLLPATWLHRLRVDGKLDPSVDSM